MKELFDMFVTFASVGVLTFGGGYAMLPMLQREVVDKRSWATEDEIADYYAIGQSTPGIIALNVATFIGYKRKGLPGAIFASLGIVFPSLVIIMLIAALISNFLDLQWVQHAFNAVRVCVTVLILNTVIRMFKSGSVMNKKTGKIDLFALIIFTLVFVLNVLLDFSPVLLVVLAGVLGIVFSCIKEKLHLRGKSGEDCGK